MSDEVISAEGLLPDGNRAPYLTGPELDRIVEENLPLYITHVVETTMRSVQGDERRPVYELTFRVGSPDGKARTKPFDKGYPSRDEQLAILRDKLQATNGGPIGPIGISRQGSRGFLSLSVWKPRIEKEEMPF
jgi:hypothetical protein